MFVDTISASWRAIWKSLGDETSECSLYKFPALLLVGIGSREQERLANLGNAVALAVRYSSDPPRDKNRG